MDVLLGIVGGLFIGTAMYHLWTDGARVIYVALGLTGLGIVGIGLLVA